MHDFRPRTSRFVILTLTGLLLLMGPAGPTGCIPKNGPHAAMDDGQTPIVTTANEKTEVREEKDSEGNLIARTEGKTDPEGSFIPHGKTTLYWPNGQKKTELHFINGLRHGPRTSWYQSGQMWILGQFAEGKEHGTWTLWYEDGRKAQESHYEHGAWHGTFTEWYRNGQKRREVEFVHGVKQGTETLWDEEGNIVRQIEYVDGVPQPQSPAP